MTRLIRFVFIASLFFPSTPLAQKAKTKSYRDPRLPVLKGNEPIDIVGKVLAHDREGGVPVGIEGGYYEVLVVRVENVIFGRVPWHYVRADFSGSAAYKTDSTLPTSFLYEGRPWRIKLHPPSGGEGCAHTIHLALTRPDDLSSELHFGVALVPVGGAKSFPDVNALYCYTFTRRDLTE